MITDTMHGELQSTTDHLPIVSVQPAAVAASPPIQIEASNTVELSIRIPDTAVNGREEIRPRKSKKTRKVVWRTEQQRGIHIQSVDRSWF